MNIVVARCRKCMDLDSGPVEGKRVTGGLCEKCFMYEEYFDGAYDDDSVGGIESLKNPRRKVIRIEECGGERGLKNVEGSHLFCVSISRSGTRCNSWIADNSDREIYFPDLDARIFLVWAADGEMAQNLADERRVSLIGRGEWSS